MRTTTPKLQCITHSTYFEGIAMDYCCTKSCASTNISFQIQGKYKQLMEDIKCIVLLKSTNYPMLYDPLLSLQIPYSKNDQNSMQKLTKISEQSY